jgi:hypothetical protein
MRIVAISSLAITALSLACNVNLDPGHSVAMQDSLEITLFGPAQEDLHTPYVAGARFNINVATTDYSGSDTSGWSLKSSNPSVVSVDSQSSPLNFQVSTATTGHATLTVVDGSGHVFDSHDVDVEEPDSVQLASHGLLLAGLSDTQAQVTRGSVVEGGTATFLVRYFKGGQELYGNGAVTATGTGSVTATTTSSSFGDDRDWIEIDAEQTAGSGQVALSVGGQTVTTIPAPVVPSSDITRVGTLAQSDSNAKDGNALFVFARAFDAGGADIYGASFSWLVGGVSATPAAGSSSARMPSDVLSYTYKGGSSETVTAGLGGETSSTTVHGSGGTVLSTADTGCSLAHGAGAGERANTGLLLAASVAAALSRRARRRSGRAPAKRLQTSF